jgi:hypothetical protein
LSRPLKNLYHVIADAPDIYATDDPFLRQQCRYFKFQISELATNLASLCQRCQLNKLDITGNNLQAFSTAIRKRLRNADPSFRRQYINLFVDEVVIVHDKVAVRRSKDVLFFSVQNCDDLITCYYLSLPVSGAPKRIRTSDPQIRSLMLYPAELWARIR